MHVRFPGRISRIAAILAFGRPPGPRRPSSRAAEEAQLFAFSRKYTIMSIPLAGDAPSWRSIVVTCPR